jgi:hypothetical protein
MTMNPRHTDIREEGGRTILDRTYKVGEEDRDRPDSPSMPVNNESQARADVLTIQRYQEIVADWKRLGAAKTEAKRQKAVLDRIERLEGKHL